MPKNNLIENKNRIKGWWLILLEIYIDINDNLEKIESIRNDRLNQIKHERERLEKQFKELKKQMKTQTNNNKNSKTESFTQSLQKDKIPQHLKIVIK